MLTTNQTTTLKTIVRDKRSGCDKYDGRTLNALKARKFVKTDTNKSGWNFVVPTAAGRKASKKS